MKLLRLIKYFILVMPIVFFSCSPDDDNDTSQWIGTWEINEEIVFPHNKTTYIGEIIQDNNNKNKIIISGNLLGLNSSYSLPATVSSSTATFDQTTSFNINGKATLINSDSIKFSFSITQDNITKNYVVGAKKKSK